MPDRKHTDRPPVSAGQRRTRSAPISYRPPRDREAAFRARVAASGLSANAFINAHVFGRNRRGAALTQDALARLHEQTATISAQLDEIMRCGGAEAVGPQTIAAVAEDLAVIRAALLDAMGRAP